MVKYIKYNEDVSVAKGFENIEIELPEESI
jgi:hypothetical protein